MDNRKGDQEKNPAGALRSESDQALAGTVTASRAAGTTRRRWFYRLVIAAVYLSAFEPLLRGMVRTVAPVLEISIVVILQSIIYLPPLFFVWYGSHDRRFVLLLGVIAFLILFYPLRIQGDLLSYFLGLKFYFACFFYIPIIKYLSKFPGFEESFLKHISYILTAFAIWAGVEFASTLYAPNIALRMKSFALFEAQQMTAGRPIGMALDYQTGAFAVAVFCILFLLQKRYVWYSLLLVLSFLVGLRTWFFAAFATSALVMMTRVNVRKPFWIIFGTALIAGFYFGMRDYIESYIEVFGGQASSGQIILDLVLSDGWFLFTNGGVLPNGFVRLGFSPIFGEPIGEIPHQFLVNEIAILRMHYQMGGIATVMWFLIMYYPFLSRGFTFYRNHYMIILFFSLFGFAHLLSIFKPFLLIFLIFCSVQSCLKQELPARLRWFRFFRHSNKPGPTEATRATA